MFLPVLCAICHVCGSCTSPGCVAPDCIVPALEHKSPRTTALSHLYWAYSCMPACPTQNWEVGNRLWKSQLIWKAAYNYLRKL